MAIGDFVYQAQAPGGVINQVVVDEPIRAKRRPVEVRPAADRAAIGRTSMLDEIRAGLGNGPVQLVAGDGWGKTAILRQAVHGRPLEVARDGVALVSGWGLPVEDLEQAVFEAFFESNLPGMNLKVSPGQLRTSFSDVEAGIAIDDLDVPRQHVERILDALPRCVILSAASQQTMWSTGTVLDVDGLTLEESVALFELRLGRPLETGERDAVAAYATGVFGYPMAIVTGAAAIRRSAMTFDQLAEAASATDPIAETTKATATTLTLRESRILAALDAVDAAPLPPAAIGAASGVEELGQDLIDLRNDGILQVASPTFRLPNATAVLLDLPDAGPATLAGLTAWAIDEADASAVSAAAAAITTAMRNASHAGNHEGAITLGRVSDAGVSLSARWGLWNRLLEQTEQAARASGSQFDLGWSLHQRGTEALATGDTSTAQELLGAARSIREVIGDTEGLEATNHNLGLVSGPPPTVDTPSDTPPTTPSSSGLDLPWWAWTMIVAGIAVIGAIAVGLLLRQPDPPPVTTTTVLEPGRIELSQSQLQFDDVPVGQTRFGTVEVINAGPGNVTINRITTADATFFSIDHDCSILDRGQACSIVVTFEPTTRDSVETVVTIFHDGANSPVDFDVIGRAIDPPSALVSAEPINLDYGAVSQAPARVIGAAEPGSEWLRTVVIRNEGNRSAEIVNAATAFGPFGTESRCGLLDPGGQCEIDVRFLAVDPGEFEGLLVVEHTGDNPRLEIPLAGIALRPPNLVVAVEGPSEFIETFPVETASGVAFWWEFTAVAVITNTGEQPVENEFFFRFEFLRREGDSGVWLPTVRRNSGSNQYPVSAGLLPLETILVPVTVAVPPGTQIGNEIPARIRAIVDSCLEDADPPAPPCRILESDEFDNTSNEYDLPIEFVVQ